MGIDSNIALGVKPVQLPDPMNAMARVLQVQAAQGQNDLARYSLAKAQRQDAETNALAQLLQGGGVDLSTPEGQAKAFQAAPTVAPSMIKNYMEGRKMTSEIGKNDAQAGKATTEATGAALSQFRDQLANVQTPEQAAQWLQAQYQHPLVGKVVASTIGPADQAIARIPTDQAQFDTWKKQNALGMTKFIELNAPKTNVINSGPVTQMVQTPGLGGAPSVVGTIKNGVSPDAALSASTSRANNAATINKDLTIAGINSDGSANHNVEQMAQAIAAGKAAPITGFALARPQGQTVMRRVFEINPQYDETAYAAKLKGARDFATGQQGNSMRSFAVAGQHLDQLGQLVDALGNGNIQLVNKLGNAFAAQTGNPAPTNFDAAKDVVSKEVVKAIVAGGGGVAEREELSNLMKSANSPAQLKGVIQQYRNLMAAQHEALLQQRDALGLSRSTLPSYTDAAGSPGATSGNGWGIQRVK